MGAEERGRELGEFIAEQRKQAEMSIRRLSDLAGISNPYLSQIERGLRRPSAEILQQIAKALEISSETLYVQAGILDEDKGKARTEVAAAIRADDSLSDQNKATLLHLYDSLREDPDAS